MRTLIRCALVAGFLASVIACGDSAKTSEDAGAGSNGSSTDGEDPDDQGGNGSDAGGTGDSGGNGGTDDDAGSTSGTDTMDGGVPPAPDSGTELVDGGVDGGEEPEIPIAERILGSDLVLHLELDPDLRLPAEAIFPADLLPPK